MNLPTTTCILSALASPVFAGMQTPDPVNITLDANYYTMAPVSDGGVIAIGQIKDENDEWDIAVRRVTPDMSTTWTVTFGGTRLDDDYLLDASPTPDGGATVLCWIQDGEPGSLDRKLLAAKISSEGDVEWTRELTDHGLNGSWDSAHKSRLVTGPDGRTCIVENILYESMLVRSFDAQGNLEWDSTVDLQESGTEMALDIQMNAAGEVLIGGLWNGSLGNGSGHFYASLSPKGNQIWSHVVNPDGLGLSETCFINVDSEGNWVTAGTLTTEGWTQQVYAAKFAPTGTLDWMTQYANEDGVSILVRDAALSTNDELVIGGLVWTSTRGMFAMKLDSDGDIKWAKEDIQPLGNSHHSTRGLAIHEDGRIELAGSFTGTVGSETDGMQLTVTMSSYGEVTDTTTWNPGTFGDVNRDVVIDAQDKVYTCGLANTTGTNFQYDGTIMQVNSCPADVQGDGEVTVTDLLMILAAFGTDHPGADLNNDGIVDVADVLIILENWNGCNG